MFQLAYEQQAQAEAEAVRRVATIEHVCGVDRERAQGAYSKFIAACRDVATTTVVSMQWAMGSGWEEYSRVLGRTADHDSAQRASEEWLSAEAERLRRGWLSISTLEAVAVCRLLGEARSLSCGGER